MALVGVVALALELLPGTASLWDEYITDVVRRVTLQAGFVGMIAGVLAATSGVSGLEVAIVAVSGYLLTLQFYFYRMKL